jgi:hypothetical protein
MSGIPTNILEVNFNDGGDGDRDPDVEMRAVIDALRGVQNSVAAISANVRAILETLRVIARSGVRGGGGGGGGRGGGGAGGGGRGAGGGGPAGTFGADILEYRTRMQRSAGLQIRDIASESHRALLTRYHDEGERSRMTRQEMSQALSLRRLEIFGEQQSGSITAEAARVMYREERERVRTAMRDARRNEVADVRAAGRRMSSEMQQRLDDLRAQARLPGATAASIGLTAQEQAVLAGQASPSGLPGTRGYFRGVRRIVEGLEAPVPAPEAPQGRFAGVMGIITVIGRVLSVARLISGLIQTILGFIRSIVQGAENQRKAFAAIDPFFAMQQAQVEIGAIRSNMAVAQSPLVRSTAAEFTQMQLARQQAGIPLRQYGSAARNKLATRFESYFLSLELFYGGLYTLNTNSIGSGLGFAAAAYIDTTIIGAGGFLGDYIRQALIKFLNTSPATNNQLFIDDLRSMTGGRFEPDRAYPMRNGNQTNWWTGRP